MEKTVDKEVVAVGYLSHYWHIHMEFDHIVDVEDIVGTYC